MDKELLVLWQTYFTIMITAHDGCIFQSYTPFVIEDVQLIIRPSNTEVCGGVNILLCDGGLVSVTENKLHAGYDSCGDNAGDN